MPGTRRGRRSAGAEADRAAKRLRAGEEERQEKKEKQEKEEEKAEQSSSAAEKARAPDTGSSGNAHQTDPLPSQQ